MVAVAVAVAVAAISHQPYGDLGGRQVARLPPSFHLSLPPLLEVVKVVNHGISEVVSPLHPHGRFFISTFNQSLNLSRQKSPGNSI